MVNTFKHHQAWQIYLVKNRPYQLCISVSKCHIFVHLACDDTKWYHYEPNRQKYRTFREKYRADKICFYEVFFLRVVQLMYSIKASCFIIPCILMTPICLVSSCSLSSCVQALQICYTCTREYAYVYINT